MAEPLKNYYDKAFTARLGKAMKAQVPSFKQAAFERAVFDADWEARELKDRTRHIAECVRQQLPDSYRDALKAVVAAGQAMPLKGSTADLTLMVFPDFIERFGVDDPEASLPAIVDVTQVFSCEFAIRPFIEQDQKGTLALMLEWTKHESEHVRRLASEGCRPRLPWGKALEALKANPTPILPILEALRNDPSEYVRRSVANNLNDITKDHPETVVKIAKRWHGETPETTWVVKHGCRNLLRAAHPEVMGLFGFASAVDCKVNNLKLDRIKVAIGDSLPFSFELVNGDPKNTKFRVEFGIDYMKANGKQSRKLFKITEND